ncbi:MAG TPA: PadR family transcriptional regulator [Solirubrobacteraceae bacterium]|nr:PadR family transcriptional regulator [Solirubrobacteraceae bacterium]
MRHAHALPHPLLAAGCGHHRQAGPGDLMAFMRSGRHGRGPGAPGWGFGGPGWGRGGPRARRGDVRAALLVLLEEEPRNGYQLMQEIEERSGGAWRPSSGAVYPALQQLEDEGLVRPEESGGRRAFALTDEGRAYVEEHRERLAAPWDAVTEAAGGGLGELRALVGQVGAAVFQVAQAGSEEQVAEAKRILTEARRALYRVLAD